MSHFLPQKSPHLHWRSSHRPASHGHSRRLTLEPLEPRVVLNGTSLSDAMFLNDAGQITETALASGVVPERNVSLLTADSLDRFASAEELKQYLIQDALQRWDHLFGRRAGDGQFAVAEILKEYSRTSVQVPGVDESDRVATDGRYLYSLFGHELVVRQVGNDAQPTLVARLALDESVRGMFLDGDRLTIVASRFETHSQARVMVFDVSDPTRPSLVEETVVDGIYIDARAMGDQVYLIAQTDFFLPEPLVKGELDFTNYQPRYYETKEEYLARIQDQVLDLVLPRFTTADGDGHAVDSGWLVEPTDILRPLSNDQTQLSQVIVFDVGDDQPGRSDAMIVASEDAAEIHFSDHNLFVLGSRIQAWGGWWDGSMSAPVGGENETAVLQFSVGAETGKLALDATGTVPGHLLGHVSFGTQDGYLRIVTSTGTGTETRTGLHVLQQNGETFDFVGQLEGIAPGEHVYTARFAGNQAYLATVAGDDPLNAFAADGMTDLKYSLDLSDPTAPAIAGELDVPGFCNYLESVGDGLLLVLGRETASRRHYPQLSLFDVSDPGNPQLLDRFTLDAGEAGGWGGFDRSSQIAWLPDYGILTVVAATPNGTAGTAAWVFKIDPSASAAGDPPLIHLATIQHPQEVRRTIQVGDKLVVTSAFEASVHDFASPEAALGSEDIRSDWLGAVQVTERKLNLAGADLWLSLEASTTGYLTFDALFDRTDQSHATLTLYDWQMNELAVSESDYPWAQARLDRLVQAGQRFFLKVSGTVAEVDLRIQNIVSYEGENTDSVLKVNCPVSDGDIEFEIYWHGNSGRPWKDEPALDALTRRLSLTVAGVHYDISINAPNVVIDGSGENSLSVDVTNITMGTSDRGNIVADLGDGCGTISCSGPVFGITAEGEEIGFEMTITDFREITVNGGDMARLRGSEGNDVLTVQPGVATMKTPTGLVRVNDFAEVYGYSSSGQSDTAKLYDTTGSDRLVATPDYATLRGVDYYARAKGFRYTHAYSTAGGEDVAKLKDSSEEDLCIATSDFVRMKGEDYQYRAKRFERVTVRAHSGSGDVANLRDAVLTSTDTTEIELEDLQVAVLLSGIDRFELRGTSADNRTETKSADFLLAYWPE